MSESVNHPSHYNSGNIEVIDFIEDQQLDFSLGNAVKYICRAGKKSSSTTVEDLKKAIWYLTDKVKRLEYKLCYTDDKPYKDCSSCSNSRSLLCKTCEDANLAGPDPMAFRVKPSNWIPRGTDE